MSEKDKEESETDRELELLFLKKKIKFLEDAEGDGTSMISLIIPPNDPVSKSMALLNNEYGTATNIKSRVNRQSVQDAITCTQNVLKQYNRIPDTGLCLYCGYAMLPDSKTSRMVKYDIVPKKALGTSLYLCSSKFNVEPLKSLLSDDKRFGFVIIDGNSCYIATLSGNDKTCLFELCVDLPKKHNKGGQSSARFGRIRMEKRDNYITKATELVKKYFVPEEMPTVSGLILGGSAEFKFQLEKELDPRLKVLKIVDTSYGSKNGFNQAVEMSKECLGSLKLIREQEVIQEFFDHVSKNTGFICYGLSNTTKALDEGLVKKLIIWDESKIYRTATVTAVTSVTSVTYTESKVDISSTECMEYLEYLTLNKSARNGATIEIVTNKTDIGAQFVQGFGGIGAILNYQIDFENIIDKDDDYDDEWDDANSDY